MTIGGVTVVADTLAEMTQQQVNDAVNIINPQQLRGVINELSDEVTRLSQLSDARWMLADRLRVKSIDAVKVVARNADIAATNGRQEDEDAQAMAQRYDVYVEGLKSERNEAHDLMEQAINDASERGQIKGGADWQAVYDLNEICQKANEVTEVVKQSFDDRTRARFARSI